MARRLLGVRSAAVTALCLAPGLLTGCSVTTTTGPELDRVYEELVEGADADDVPEKSYMGSRDRYDYICMTVWDLDDQDRASNPRRRFYRVPQGQDRDVNAVVRRRFPLTWEPARWVEIYPVAVPQ